MSSYNNRSSGVLLNKFIHSWQYLWRHTHVRIIKSNMYHCSSWTTWVLLLEVVDVVIPVNKILGSSERYYNLIFWRIISCITLGSLHIVREHTDRSLESWISWACSSALPILNRIIITIGSGSIVECVHTITSIISLGKDSASKTQQLWYKSDTSHLINYIIFMKFSILLVEKQS